MAEKKILWNLIRLYGKISSKLAYRLQKDNGKLVLFDTSIDTDNAGDHIIMKYCKENIKPLTDSREIICLPTHSCPSAEQEKTAKATKYKFVCGTNLLTSHIEYSWNWRLPDGIRRKINYRNTILMGAGWKGYEDDCSLYSRMVYQCILNPNVIHSVRDSYTENQLKKAGIKNVINTGCPTMWRLTESFCADIPQKKADNVITTITDYRPDQESDQNLLNILSRNYKTVYLWLQGDHDNEYLSQLNVPNNVVTIPQNLESYEEVLNRGNLDYIGTRLHAGIFALNHKIRSIIIAVDNRAIEIAKDTNLYIMPRTAISDKLEETLIHDIQMNIKLPSKNIKAFLNQFN